MTYPSYLSLLDLFYPHTSVDVAFTGHYCSQSGHLLSPTTLKMIHVATPQRDKQQIYVISQGNIRH